MRGRIAAGLVALALVAGVAGCGGDSGGDPEQPPPPAAGGGPQADIARGDVNQEQLDAIHETIAAEKRLSDHLVAKGAVEDPDGISVLVFPPGGEECHVSVLLTSAGALATYGYGDGEQPVVANPAGTMGVKASTTAQGRAECLSALTDALSDLD